MHKAGGQQWPKPSADYSDQRCLFCWKSSETIVVYEINEPKSKDTRDSDKNSNQSKKFI